MSYFTLTVSVIHVLLYTPLFQWLLSSSHSLFKRLLSYFTFHCSSDSCFTLHSTLPVILVFFTFTVKATPVLLHNHCSSDSCLTSHSIDPVIHVSLYTPLFKWFLSSSNCSSDSFLTSHSTVPVIHVLLYTPLFQWFMPYFTLHGSSDSCLLHNPCSSDSVFTLHCSSDILSSSCTPASNPMVPATRELKRRNPPVSEQYFCQPDCVYTVLAYPTVCRYV